ncbi:hypothetical protein GW17_00027252 [Ensete ventricosum]|nr:hypothetical protein GW17_00027252 [Ensete ventricosum]
MPVSLLLPAHRLTLLHLKLCLCFHSTGLWVHSTAPYFPSDIQTNATVNGTLLTASRTCLTHLKTYTTRSDADITTNRIRTGAYNRQLVEYIRLALLLQSLRVAEALELIPLLFPLSLAQEEVCVGDENESAVPVDSVAGLEEESGVRQATSEPARKSVARTQKDYAYEASASIVELKMSIKLKLALNQRRYTLLASGLSARRFTSRGTTDARRQAITYSASAVSRLAACRRAPSNHRVARLAPRCRVTTLPRHVRR